MGTFHVHILPHGTNVCDFTQQNVGFPSSSKFQNFVTCKEAEVDEIGTDIGIWDYFIIARSHTIRRIYQF